MDVKLRNGDMVLDSTGSVVYIDGMEEIVQRVLICVTARKGSFLYQKNLGCDARVDFSTERGMKKLESRLREAILPVAGAELVLREAKSTDEGIRAFITIIYNDEKMDTEVII